MNDTDYVALDARFFSHPFPAQLHHHVNAEKAFAGSKLGTLQNCGLMYAFVTGAPYETITTMEQFERQDGQVDLRNGVTSTVSVQAIRANFSRWRSVLFREPAYLTTIFQVVARTSLFARAQEDGCENLLCTFTDFALVRGVAGAQRTKHMHFWSTLRDCFYDCRSGLTIPAHKQKFNSFTTSDLSVIFWREFLEGRGVDPLFGPWADARTAALQKAALELIRAIEKTRSCSACANQEVNLLHNCLLQSIYAYLARFRIRDDREAFHDHFFSALIYAFVRAEIWIVVRELSRQRERWSMLSIDRQELWKAACYELDHSYARLVNSIMGTMIDCLAHANRT